ncbi:hypothetical protein MKX01_031392 [Papaver californicum]|nr:hypothetical protein MKX01_031392 [Papaver californicum]
MEREKKGIVCVTGGGSIGVLRECLKSKTVKTVIYTSSAAAVVFISIKKDKAILQFREQHGLDLVSVLPSMIRFREMEGEHREGTGKIVCVTGEAGYLASWLIMKLLQRGYSVRTTVRVDPKFNEDVSNLKALLEAAEKLQIFEADLESPKSFIDAIDGTLGILKSCLKSKTVKKVVYTSSSSATMMISNLKFVKEIDETMWSEVDHFISKPEQVIPGGLSYVVSKTLTERAALKFSEEHGLDIVTTLPSMIVGPFITPNLPISVSMALFIILGYVYALIFLHNARDRKMMIRLKPTNAEDIYVSQFDFTIHDVAKFIAEKYPEFYLLKEIEEEKPVHLSSDNLFFFYYKKTQ